MFTISCPPKVIWLGRKGENEFRTIEVEVSEWLRDYPNGTVSVVYHRPDGAIYLPTVTTSGNITSWLITATDTAIAGKGEVEYRIIDGDIIGKSVKMPTMVSAAINATTDAPAPPPEDWTAVAAEILGMIGDLDNLDTEAKNNLVAAINEAFNSGGGGGGTSDHRQLTHRDAANQHPMSAITGLQTALDGKASAASVAAIEAKIPSAATNTNQLADKAFVNSTVGTNTAIFRGTFNSVAELEAYSGEKTNNDYAFVITTDANGNTVYNRYKFNGSAWVYEYSLNNSSFTATQWAAIQSGITAEDVALVATAVQPADLTDYALKSDLDELDERVTALEEGGSGVTSAMSESLWALLEKTEYVTAPTDAELTAFKAAWGLKYLASISAIYSGGNVEAGTNVEELRDDLVVTANYSDGTTETVTDYLLAGVLYEGENTVTVTYQLKTTTFTVTAEVGKLYLYKDGVLDTDVTGGLVNVNTQYNNNNTGVVWQQAWSDGVPVYGENSFELAVPRNSYSQKTYRTANKIDLTNFTSIHILGNATLSSSGELSHDVTEANTETVIYGVTQGSNNSDWATNIGYRGAETIVDVSELTGEYYFIAAMRKGASWSPSLTQTVSAIWLE